MTLQLQTDVEPKAPTPDRSPAPDSPALIEGGTYKMDGDLDKMAADLASIALKVGKVVAADVGSVQSKKGAGSSFKYSYAGLPTIIGALQPILSAHKVGLVQVPLSTLKGAGAVTTILGQGWRISCTLMFAAGAGGSPQSVGSLVSYARRYALLGLFALAPEEDNGDGQRAEEDYRRRQGQRQQQADQRQGRGSKPANPALIVEAFAKLNVKESALVAELGGTPIAKVTDAHTRHLRVLMQRLNAGEGVEDVFSSAALEVMMRPELSQPDELAKQIKRDVHGQEGEPWPASSAQDPDLGPDSDELFGDDKVTGYQDPGDSQ